MMRFPPDMPTRYAHLSPEVVSYQEPSQATLRSTLAAPVMCRRARFGAFQNTSKRSFTTRLANRLSQFVA